MINKRLEKVRENQRKYRESQTEKGKHGAEKRWKGEIAGAIPPAIAQAQPNDSSSSSIFISNSKEEIVRSSKSKRTIAMADEEFIETLKQNPAYKGIDLDREIGKLDAWLLTPRGRGKKKTQQRLVNWLNRTENPMETKPKTESYYRDAVPPLPEDGQRDPAGLEKLRELMKGIG